MRSKKLICFDCDFMGHKPKRPLIIRILNRMKKKVYIIAFPRSGSTWLRYIIGYYLSYKLDQPFNPNQLTGRGFPNFVIDHSIMELPHHRIVPYNKVSEIFHPEKYKGKKNIFLLRNPKDIMVSLWHAIWSIISPEKMPLEEFVKNDLVGIKKLVAFYNLWAPILKKDSYLVIIYKYMPNEIYKIFDYLNIDIDEECMKKAIEESSFEKMKVTSNKARRGKVYGYKDEMDAKTIEYIDDYIGHNLDDFYKSFLK